MVQGRKERQIFRQVTELFAALCFASGFVSGQEESSPYRDFYDRLLYPEGETGVFKPGDVASSRREILPLGVDATVGDTLYYVVTYVFDLNLPRSNDPASEVMSLLVVEDLQTGNILAQYQWGWSRVDTLHVTWFAAWDASQPQRHGRNFLRTHLPKPLTPGPASPESRGRLRFVPNRGVPSPAYVHDLDRLSTADPDTLDHRNEEGFFWRNVSRHPWSRFAGKLVVVHSGGDSHLLRRYRPGRASDESHNMKMSWRFFWDAPANRLICIEGEQYSIQASRLPEEPVSGPTGKEFSILRERLQVFPMANSR